MKLTQANIEAIKQNTSNALTKRVSNYVLDEWGNYDDKKNIFTDVLRSRSCDTFSVNNTRL